MQKIRKRLKFQSTPSVGRATSSCLSRYLTAFLFQSTPSVGRATFALTVLGRRYRISIHALRGEGDTSVVPFLATFSKFQSTPSVGRATKRNGHCWHNRKNFNPRPPWGGRPYRHGLINHVRGISIHALRGEGDKNSGDNMEIITKFQSTPSVGRATCMKLTAISKAVYFNPRPPWGGRLLLNADDVMHIHFNPRPPWGGRRYALNAHIPAISQFQSTPSVGRATSACQ